LASMTVYVDSVGCNGGAPSAAAFCVSGHVDGIAVGSTGYSVSFQIVNQPGNPAYSSSSSTPVNATNTPATWNFGPGAMSPLNPTEAVTLTATLYLNGIPVGGAQPGNSSFTLNP